MKLLEKGRFAAAVLDHSLFEEQEDPLSLYGRRIPYELIEAVGKLIDDER